MGFCGDCRRWPMFALLLRFLEKQTLPPMSFVAWATLNGWIGKSSWTDMMSDTYC